MNAFKSAVENTEEYGFTDNGALTLTSSLSKCVDLFFLIGSARQRPGDALAAFKTAFAHNPKIALQILLWARDIRGGAGERAVPRFIIQSMLSDVAFKKYVPTLIDWIPFFGRWDDLLLFLDTEYASLAAVKISTGLSEGNGLCAKWLPRKGKVAAKLRSLLFMSPKQYRKTLVDLSKTVEQDMCAKRWDKINYNHVPAVASARYQKAFGRNDSTRYGEYLSALTNKVEGVKINASVVYPYDVIRSLMLGNATAAVAQWEALPNYLGDSGHIMPVCDVSGSMHTPVSGSVTALDVCLSLGLYLADKQKGPFQDMVLTFSSKSKIEVLKGNIQQKVQQLSHMHWEMNTNLQSAFEAILDLAVKNKIAEKDMPRYIMVMSDMEFDSCCSGGTNYDEIYARYRYAGYKLPKIIFWNLNGRAGNSPVTIRDADTALISGFSPAIMTSVLAAKNVTPESIMMTTVDVPKYNVF